MRIAVKEVDFHILNMRTRMPFKYGIASLTALPHLFLSLKLEVDGQQQLGISSEGLPPKWFTKNPNTRFEDDLVEMLGVIRCATEFALEQSPAASLFDFWKRLYDTQNQWGRERTLPPLLTGLGTSLTERAMIDAFCRLTDTTFEHALRQNSLGIELGRIHKELTGSSPSDLLEMVAPRSIAIRHTVGLADPLTDDEISGEERLEDGLPQSLEENIRVYGLTHFKIKVCGKIEQDLARLRKLAIVIGINTAEDYLFTLDGNEQFTDLESFKRLWNDIRNDSELSRFMEHLMFVEQPLHRDVSMLPEVQTALDQWSDRPPMIIDESDGDLSSARQALEMGYSGTSHKNCKGVFKGIANACLIAHRQKHDSEHQYVLSSEDLANVGPIALLQDLSVLSSLGIDNSERNGHHYFKGLSMFPQEIQSSVLSAHADLYHRHDQNFATLAIQSGHIHIGTVVDAPFGYGFEFDPSQFTPLSDWSAESLAL